MVPGRGEGPAVSRGPVTEPEISFTACGCLHRVHVPHFQWLPCFEGFPVGSSLGH